MFSLQQMVNAPLGEQSSTLRAKFRKTVNIKQYETEVIEADTELEVNKQLSGAERVLLNTLLQIQLEYEVYLNLLGKLHITKTEFDTRMKVLEENGNQAIALAMSAGVNVSQIIGDNGAFYTVGQSVL